MKKDKPEDKRNANKFQAFRRALYSKNGITYKRFWKLFDNATFYEKSVVIETLGRVKSHAKIWFDDNTRVTIENFRGSVWHTAIWGHTKWLKITVPAYHKMMSLEEVVLWISNRKNSPRFNPRPISRHERSYIARCRVEGGDTMTARDLFNFANSVCEARFPISDFAKL